MTDNRNTEVAYLPPAVPPTNHGHTTAAWTAMIGIIVGAVVAGIGFLPFVPTTVFWVGVAIVVVANVAGLVLRNLGYGQPKPGVTPKRAPAAH